jgi:Tol biopolymer transport system component
VKVLDFGLAKAIGAGIDLPPSTSFDGTAEARILGTPAYMSPEQARGQVVDKRTDIWAFGCALFEMLTGRRAFEGKSVTDTLALVLEREPDWAALAAKTPDVISQLLRRCLQKDPTRRLRDVGDARLEIEETLVAAPWKRGPSSDHEASASRRRVLGASALGAAAILAVLTLRFDVWVTPWPSPTASGLEVTRLTFDDGLQTDPALAPDGQFVAYSSNDRGNFDIYTQPVRGGKAVPVTDHPAHDWQPHWSVKDQLVFRSERDSGGLFVVGPTGGHEQRVAGFGYQPQWSPDGLAVLFSKSSFATMLFTVSRDGSDPRECVPCSDRALEERAPHGSGAFGWFRDARHVSTLLSEAAPQYRPHLRIVDLESGTADEWTVASSVLAVFQDMRILVPSRPLAWSPDARAIYFVGVSRGIAAVWKLDVVPDERMVSGGPHRMTMMAEATGGLAIARTGGSVAFAAAAGHARASWYPLDASGRRIKGQPEVMTPAEAQAFDPDITPDARLLVYSLRRPGGVGGTELRARTPADGADRILRISDTERGEQRTVPHASPHGRHVVYRYVAPESEGTGRGGGAFGPQDLRWLDLTTSKESKLTQTTAGTVLPGGWSPDSRFVVACLERRRIEKHATGMMIGLLPLSKAPAAEAHMKLVTASDARLYQPSMSPDARWVVFVSNRKGISRIAVVRSKDGLWNDPVEERHWRYIDEDLSRKDKPRWSADGRHIYFTSERGGLLNVWAVDFSPDTGARGTPFRVTEFDGPGEQMPTNMFSLEIGAARGGLVIPTLRPAGAIWLLHPPR